VPSVFVRKPSTKRLAAFLLLKGMGAPYPETPLAPAFCLILSTSELGRLTGTLAKSIQ
jgi:hypothetical protein